MTDRPTLTRVLAEAARYEASPEAIDCQVQRILADPRPLLAALAREGILDSDHSARLDLGRPTTMHRYVSDWVLCDGHG